MKGFVNTKVLAVAIYHLHRNLWMRWWVDVQLRINFNRNPLASCTSPHALHSIFTLLFKWVSRVESHQFQLLFLYLLLCFHRDVFSWAGVLSSKQRGDWSMLFAIMLLRSKKKSKNRRGSFGIMLIKFLPKPTRAGSSIYLQKIVNVASIDHRASTHVLF